jgi:hypothetical protein
MAAPTRPGPGKITAALLGAPAAALLASLVLCSLLPPPDWRLFLFVFAGLPAIAAAPCLVLLAKDGLRAWIGVAAVAIPCTLLLVFS